MAASGILYIVATPIGNMQDITLRALEVLKNADVILCEERREGTTLLKRLEIPSKEILQVNEHNEKQMQQQVLERLATGKNIAMISDCGTPVFADPGAEVIKSASQAGFDVVPIPGVSSLMAALSILDFRAEPFYFAGFLPRQENERLNALQRLKPIKAAVVLMDTPYRLGRLLQVVLKALGAKQQVTLGFNLTLPDEKIYRGEVKAVMEQVGARKGEFILILHPNQ
jgi:16S rRNA (cytidine1402-2'-O)-methyltransferase